MEVPKFTSDVLEKEKKPQGEVVIESTGAIGDAILATALIPVLNKAGS